MAKSKKQDEPNQPSEQEALEKKIDAMMDPRQPEPASAPAAPPAGPEIDIFKDIKSAPEIDKKLLKTIGVAKDDKLETAKPAEAAAEPSAPIPPTVQPTSAPPLPKREGKTIKPVAESSLPAPEEVTIKPAPDVKRVTPPSEPAPPVAAEPLNPDLDAKDPYDDPETDKAVDEIVVKDADELLAAQSSAGVPPAKKQATVKKTRPARNWSKVFKSKWLWLLVPVIVAGLLAIPAVRYAAFGLFTKKSVAVTILDSTTKTPVSDAEVAAGTTKTKTNADGHASLKVKPGTTTISVNKKYYKTYNQAYTVGLAGNPTVKINLVATGRQVPVTVVNTITGKPVSDAEIELLNTTVRTNSQGKALLVLPAKGNTDGASITASGFNAAKVSVKVTSSVVPENTFSLTPSGKVYFLSNKNGTIDVVKANLDGTERQTVLAGTGREDSRTTSLLASRDWRYLALKSKRESARPALYIIDTKTDKLSQVDGAGAEYQLVGWYGHNFVYDAVNQSMSRWQTGREILKSYNAERDDLKPLDQNQAEGGATSYAYVSFYNFYLLDGSVAYNTQWYTYDATGNDVDLSNKTDAVRLAAIATQTKKDSQTFPAKSVGYMQAALYEPNGVYYSVYTNDDNKTVFYQLEDEKVSQTSTLSPDALSKNYPTYLVSPGGKQTFWTELRDGKNTLFTGDANAKSKKQIATLSDYAPYGWFSDNYVLLSKNSSELYVMSATGATKTKQPLKITDYYKPDQTYAGYGYGYGGL